MSRRIKKSTIRRLRGRSRISRLTEEERQRILLTCNEWEFPALSPGQIVPIVADRGLYICTDCSFYRVLHPHRQAHRRGRACLRRGAPPSPRLRSEGAESDLEIGHHLLAHHCSWGVDVPLPGGRCLEPQNRGLGCHRAGRRSYISGDLISRACLRECMGLWRPQPLMLHAYNGKAMRAATLESRLEELGLLRSFSRPRVSNDNPFSESLSRTLK